MQFAICYKSRDPERISSERDRSYPINLLAAKKSTICLKVPEQDARCIICVGRLRSADIKGGRLPLHARVVFRQSIKRERERERESEKEGESDVGKIS